jgi:hypothetical protein
MLLWMFWKIICRTSGTKSVWNAGIVGNKRLELDERITEEIRSSAKTIYDEAKMRLSDKFGPVNNDDDDDDDEDYRGPAPPDFGRDELPLSSWREQEWI